MEMFQRRRCQVAKFDTWFNLYDIFGLRFAFPKMHQMGLYAMTFLVCAFNSTSRLWRSGFLSE